MKSFLKKFIPEFILQIYHYCLAILANFFYGQPSEKLIVIGITGTSGKSTAVYLLSKILERVGYKVGATSTIGFKIADIEWLNDKKMTMLGRFQLQKLLKQMIKAGCQYAIIETTSQGILQYRHLGINYDIAVLTNLYPEHLEAHGGFQNYKKTKLKLFKHLAESKEKIIAEKIIKKTIVVNLDDENTFNFLNFWIPKKIGFTLGKQKCFSENCNVIRAENIVLDNLGSKFTIQGSEFRINLLGEHNIYNALIVITICLSLGISLEKISQALVKISNLPGRLEFIDIGQPFKVIIDYAFEPKAMKKFYQVVKNISHQKIIQVLGSAGGGRDKSRRPILGKLAGEFADYVIITNEDPYDEEPQIIIDQVATGAIEAGKILDQNLFKILDRREAIAKALSLAKEKEDLVLITGKGSEQGIVVKNNKIISWDDREVVKEELKQLTNNN